MTNESTFRKSPRFSAEVRERAVRMVQEHRSDHASHWAAIVSISTKIGCTAETLRRWVHEAGRNQWRDAAGQAPGASADCAPLERENRELRQANEILRKASAYFAQAGARPPTEVKVSFVDAYRDDHGVEPICEIIEIAPSTYYEQVRRRKHPETAPARVQRDASLMQVDLPGFSGERIALPVTVSGAPPRRLSG